MRLKRLIFLATIILYVILPTQPLALSAPISLDYFYGHNSTLHLISFYYVKNPLAQKITKKKAFLQFLSMLFLFLHLCNVKPPASCTLGLEIIRLPGNVMEIFREGPSFKG